jgi:polyhydroxybutyrate depolymerase
LWRPNGRSLYPHPDDGTTITVLSYDDCELDTAVKLVQIDGGGHTWPGGWQYLSADTIGATSQELNAADIIWAFFQQFQ